MGKRRSRERNRAVLPLGVWLAALHESGRGTTVRQMLVSVGSGGLEPQGDASRLVADVDLEEGRHAIAVGVRDEMGAAESYVRFDFDVPNPTVPFR